MLASQLINAGFPIVNLFDKASFALQLMDDYDVLHLPVLSGEKFAGMISKDDLLDIDDEGTISSVQSTLLNKFIKADAHFLQAFKLIAENDLSLLPVLNEQAEMMGVITAKQLMHTVSLFIGNEDPGGIIVLETDKRNFSLGEINRLVETNDAYITQLNTHTEADTGLVIITLKVNKQEIADIIATFQRYDYAVRYYFGEESYANELKENYDHLISYMNI